MTSASGGNPGERDPGDEPTAVDGTDDLDSSTAHNEVVGLGDDSAPVTSSDGDRPYVGDSDTGAEPPPSAGDTTLSSRSQKRRRRPQRQTPLWKETLILVGTALILALIIKTFFIQAFFIPSGSMENTLQINDRILVEKVSYWFGSVQRGDIVVFDDPDNWLGEEDGTSPTNPVTKVLADIGLYPSGGHLVKRVIGVGGDHVACHDGRVIVNGVALHEKGYVTLAPEACVGAWSVVVPLDHLWVLGDNRDRSADSRAHMGDPGGGFVPDRDVVGKVFVIVWPPSRWQVFSRPHTFDNPALNTAAGLVQDTMPMGAVLFFAPAVYRRWPPRKRRSR